MFYLTHRLTVTKFMCIGSLYYPDWINDSQVCLNDGADPEYMLQVQRENYLYRSKEECCEVSF